MFDAVQLSLTGAAQSTSASAKSASARSGVDVFIAVAAVADWRVANYNTSKIKKTGSAKLPELQFAENPDILASVAKRANPPYCVGFAAESEDIEKNAVAKRIRKDVPLLVANIGHQTFGRDDNELLLVDAEGMTRLPRADKQALAKSLVTEIAHRLPATVKPVAATKK